MSKRIIISTSWDKLNFIGRARETKNLNLLSLKSEDGKKFINKFIGYNHTTNAFEAKKIDTDIILIQDTAMLGDLIDAGLTFNKETDYFLHHTNNNGLLNKQDQQFKATTSGAHETAKEHKYKPVFDFILGEDNNKAQRIIEFLFPTADSILGKKLDLLHSLLVPPVDFTDANAKWKEIGEAIKIAPKEANLSPLDANALETFTTAIIGKTDAFDKGYLEALTILRDALLN